jgi:hypothetical protein
MTWQRNRWQNHLRRSVVVASTAVALFTMPWSMASAATPGGYHILNRAARISFYVPVHFVREAGSNYLEENLWNSSLSIQIYAQNPYGEVSVSDEKTYLEGWPANDALKVGKSKYVHETFGRVASTSFSYLPTGFTTRFDGVDLRFIDGSRSYDVQVDAPGSEEVTAVIVAILSSWGT